MVVLLLATVGYVLPETGGNVLICVQFPPLVVKLSNSRLIVISASAKMTCAFTLAKTPAGGVSFIPLIVTFTVE